VGHAAEVVVVGGGVAGAAVAMLLARRGISVLVLERSAKYVDHVRGEFIVPWGVAQAQALGLYEVLIGAGGNHIRWHLPYGEGVDPEVARGRALDLGELVPGVPGSLCIAHPVMCDALNAAAEAAGAQILRDVRHVRVASGDPPAVSFNFGGTEHSLRPKLIVGADGRESSVARQIGAKALRGPPHHLIAGLLVDGTEGWAEDEQTIGVEGDVCYYVFPQGAGRARLYLCYSREQMRRLAGGNRAAKFLEAFRLAYLPASEALASAAPAGPCHSYPNEEIRHDPQAVAGIVLIGDAAGYDDPTMGQGLSNAFHDVRLVIDALDGNKKWTSDIFTTYLTERNERSERQSVLSQLTARVRIEFDDEARARRHRFQKRLIADPNVALLLKAPLVGPHTMPREIFNERVWRPLVA
jgi:2-polyprenyl-6-methoxyphenol hydroxylase-like FAD-dependent oxidoreductase